MKTGSDSIAVQDVGQVFRRLAREHARLERHQDSARGFLIATVNLQKMTEYLKTSRLPSF